MELRKALRRLARGSSSVAGVKAALAPALWDGVDVRLNVLDTYRRVGW